jgi:hypothetical protein
MLTLASVRPIGSSQLSSSIPLGVAIMYMQDAQLVSVGLRGWSHLWCYVVRCNILKGHLM